jgi:hypothetical protein
VILSVKVFNQSKKQVNSLKTTTGMDSFIQATYQFTLEAVDALSEVFEQIKDCFVNSTPPKKDA